MKDFLNGFGILSVLLFAFVFSILSLNTWIDDVQAKGAEQQRRVPVVNEHVIVRGRVVVSPVATLPRFQTPITVAPVLVPPERRGYSWHWHTHYGWVSLPLAIAPAVVVLPADYTLPEKVETYQVRATECVCPYCGHPLTIR
jgi:hypothetical protein